MNTGYKSDYRRIQNAALNREAPFFPLYEHNIHPSVIAKIIGREIELLQESRDPADLDEYFTQLAAFHNRFGYDCFSFEGCLTMIIQGGEGLMGRGEVLIKDRADFNSYPWEELPSRYFELFRPSFESLRRTLPEGIKIVGGVGNGLFETIQDFVPFTDLAYLQADDPELFADLWARIGDTLVSIWKQFLAEYGDLLALGRFGDDLGFKSAPLLAPDTIREHVIPQYKKIVSLIKGTGVPFLLHSCGSIFDVMDDIIEQTGIDAKHSNEDAIAPFGKWIELYGDRIGNFGGLDMDVICRSKEDDLRKYIRDVIIPIKDTPGLAVGSGNQIADYIPPENFIIMVDELRKIRKA